MRLTDPAWFVALGDVARSIGNEEFQGRLLRLFGDVIRHDMSMLVRYSRFSAPDFLICESFPRHLVELYRSGYYRYDPFYRYWQTLERGGVVSLGEVSPPDLKRSRYRQVFQRQAHICDELGMFLPGVGRTSIALFLERSDGWFSAAEIEQARLIYPTVAGLYKAHVARVFATLGSNSSIALSPHLLRPMLLVDSSGIRVYANKAWREAESQSAEVGHNIKRLMGSSERQVALSDNRVLHVEGLDQEFALAPAGRMFVIEQLGLPPRRLPSRDMTVRFDTNLTRREREIVGLILDGHPSTAIAQRLRISVGTVKNHRRRLYCKLDITTERELFLLYLQSISSPDSEPTSKRVKS